MKGEETMLKNVAAIVLVLLLCASSGLAVDDPRDIAGYGKTTWGMTPNEVINAEGPRAEKLDKPERFNTGLGIVTINEIQIEVTKFRAIFIFYESGQRLEQVNLTSMEKKNPGINASSFSAVEKLLTEKYGPPTYKEATRVVSWKLKKTIIELKHTNIPGILSQVMVIYKSSAASEKKAGDL
jgi:hypothetical protein